MHAGQLGLMLAKCFDVPGADGETTWEMPVYLGGVLPLKRALK